MAMVANMLRGFMMFLVDCAKLPLSCFEDTPRSPAGLCVAAFRQRRSGADPAGAVMPQLPADDHLFGFECRARIEGFELQQDLRMAPCQHRSTPSSRCGA